MQSVESRVNPTEKIQTYVGNQLRELRSEMLKFDEVVAESRKTQDLNDALNNKLAAEREEAHKMNERIETLSGQEEELKKHKVQLECQLAELHDKYRDQITDMSTLQQGMEDLRRQLKLVKDECSEAKAEIKRLLKNIQKRDKKIADYDVSCFHLLRASLY
jgi:chromosome segregation ATPase